MDARSPAGTIDALWHWPLGEAVAMVEGTSDYAPGDLRLSFLVVGRNGQTVERLRAHVWVGRSLKSTPFAEATATLQPVGVPTTRSPPDLSLLHVSVAGALAAHEPFVLVFATPKFCTSRTCGPVVDVVEHVSKGFPGVRFIHVEIYQGNDPQRGPNRWVREWRLPSEPGTFLVGRDGRIKAKFEGSISVGELTRAVRATLLR